MFRIRLHGRGGQGMKTGGQILGSAFFAAGWEVQDAPRYGAERRGAPIFSYVRAAREPINERGIIARPDLVVVADETLVPVPAAGVTQGAGERCVTLIYSAEAAEVWKDRLKLAGPVLTLPPPQPGADLPPIGAACAGAAARLVGVISRGQLEQALRAELGDHGEQVVQDNLRQAFHAWDALEAQAGLVQEGGVSAVAGSSAPAWVELADEDPLRAAPDIHATLTSERVPTGLWRTMRPVIDYEHCNRCSWICSTFCPDGAIRVEPDHTPVIDLDHCKGCLVCVAVCPPHAIRAVAEREAASEEQGL